MTYSYITSYEDLELTFNRQINYRSLLILFFLQLPFLIIDFYICDTLSDTLRCFLIIGNIITVTMTLKLITMNTSNKYYISVTKLVPYAKTSLLISTLVTTLIYWNSNPIVNSSKGINLTSYFTSRVIIIIFYCMCNLCGNTCIFEESTDAEKLINTTYNSNLSSHSLTV